MMKDMRFAATIEISRKADAVKLQSGHVEVGQQGIQVWRFRHDQHVADRELCRRRDGGQKGRSPPKVLT